MLQGATRTWDGSYSQYWSASSNWVENDAPDPGDDLVFPAGAANLHNYNNLGNDTYSSITISGDGYTIDGISTGETIGITGGINATAAGSVNTIALNIDLESTQYFYGSSSTAALYINGDVDLGNYTLILDGAGSVHLAGVVKGTGKIEKTNTGTAWLQGASANTYTGSTYVYQGTLMLAKSVIDGAINAGTLYVGNGVGSSDTAIVREQSSYQIGTIPIIVKSDGWLDVDDYYDTVGTITFNGGHAGSTAAGTLSLGGDVTVNAASSEAIFDGNVRLISATRTFNVHDGSSVGYDLRVNAVLSNGGIVKTGSGVMALSSANTYTGETMVSGGSIYVRDNNALGTTDGGTTCNSSGLLYLVGVDVGAEPLTLDRADEIVLYAGGISSWAGDIVLNKSARIGTSSSLVLSGAISGSGGIEFAGYGELTLSGSGANTYTGDTYVDDGTLYLNKTTWDGAVSGPGDLYVGDGASAPDSMMVQWLRNNQVDEDVTLNVIPGGTLDLNGHDDLVGPLVLDSAGITSGSGTIKLNSSVTATKQSELGEFPYIEGNLDLGSSTRIFNVTNTNPVWAELSVTAQVDGNAGIQKTGNGLISLSASNTYSGVTTVDQGTFSIEDNYSLGSAAEGTVVMEGASLWLQDGSRVVDESLSLSGNGGSAWATLASWNADNSWTGEITLETPDVRIGVYTNTTLTLSGVIDGTGGFTKNLEGSLTLSGSEVNTYTGNTRVNSGTLVLNKLVGADSAIPGDLFVGDGIGVAGSDIVRFERPNQIKNTADVTISSSGLLDLFGGYRYDRVNRVTGTGLIDLDNGHLIAGHSGSSFTFDGVVSGSGYLWKVGGGTWTLTADNTYSGTTKIAEGTLIVNGSQPSSDVQIDASGTLGGIGTVGAVDCDGSIAPGASAGQLSSGSAAMQAGSSFDLELDGYTSVDYDQLDVGGSVALGNANLNIVWGFVPAVGDSFTIIDNDGIDAVSGTFNGLPEGASVTAGNVKLNITYAGGTGNDVVLSATDVQPLEALSITGFGVSGGSANLGWSGGVPFFRIEEKESLGDATWTTVSAPTRDFGASVPATASNAFYRVTGGH